MAIAARVYDTECDRQNRSEAANLVSQANYSSQVKLIEQLRLAREMSSLSTLDVAKKLHTTVDMIEDIESGDHELNLSELRQLAYAVDTFIEFRVHFRASETISQKLADLHSKLSAGYWRTHDESPWDQVISSKLVVEQILDRNITDREK